MELTVGDPYSFTAGPKQDSEPSLGAMTRKFKYATYRGKEADGDFVFDLPLIVDPTGVDFVPMKGVPMNNVNNNGNNNSTVAGSVIGIRNNNNNSNNSNSSRAKSGTNGRKTRKNRKDRKDKRRRN
jgi:hypothetical protein